MVAKEHQHKQKAPHDVVVSPYQALIGSMGLAGRRQGGEMRQCSKCASLSPRRAISTTKIPSNGIEEQHKEACWGEKTEDNMPQMCDTTITYTHTIC